LEKILIIIFFTLVITVPFLYRIIRLGGLSWFVKKDQIGHDQNYDKAEQLRFVQIIIGYCYFILHGSISWGWVNNILFTLIAFFISISMEVLGSNFGFIFGGKYKYDPEKSPGPLYAGIPLVIPVSWAGLIYMSLNYSMLILGHEYFVSSYRGMVILMIPSLLLTILDLVLDPIAVDEKRWEWKTPGPYHKVPLFNFVGWFFTTLIILWLFTILHVPIIAGTDSSLLFQYSPGLLFSILPAIASRPCFERGLKIPGIIGLIFSIGMIAIIIITNGENIFQ
jgi:uncharacterized membrane protein